MLMTSGTDGWHLDHSLTEMVDCGSRGWSARVGNGTLPVLPKAAAGSNQNLAAMATVVL